MGIRDTFLNEEMLVHSLQCFDLRSSMRPCCHRLPCCHASQTETRCAKGIAGRRSHRALEILEGMHAAAGSKKTKNVCDRVTDSDSSIDR